MNFRANVFILLLGGALSASSAQGSVLNHAAGFRWKGHVGTSLPMSSFVNGQHSVAFKFMAQYPHSYQGPMFTTSVDDNYLIAIGDYSPSGSSEKVRLELAVGGNSAYFSGQNVATDVVAGKWNSLIVVKESGKYRVYLNSQLLSREGCSSSCTEFSPGPGTISGNVRFGRNTDPNTQFYGFMDDILVFDHALNSVERAIVNLVDRASGSENGVIRAWTFDDAMPNGEPNPPTIGSGNFVSPAYKGLVSEQRDDAFDAKLLPPPTVTVDLPFTRDVNWKVLWGFDEPNSSHHGSAAFAWDFRRNSGEPDTCGATLRAAASGTVISAYDSGGDLDPNDDVPNPPIDAYNDILIQLATPGEYLRYLHVLTDSIQDAFNLDPADFPPTGPTFGVTKGDKVAEAGTRGPDNCHLHFGYSNGTVTIPLGYNYERWVSTNGGYWTTITNGMPRTDEIIQRP
jgi:hypothetical protein